MALTPEVRQEIIDAHSRNPQRFSPFRVSTALGVPIDEVMEVVDGLSEKSNGRKPRFDGYGDPAMKEHLMARRKAMGPGWDNTREKVALARKRFEEGTHIMVTGRDGPFLLLYSIPRKRPVEAQPNYFSLRSS